jgi:hypothetical protein
LLLAVETPESKSEKFRFEKYDMTDGAAVDGLRGI